MQHATTNHSCSTKHCQCEAQLEHDVVAHCGPVARVAGLLPQAAAAPAQGAPAPQADASATRRQAASALTLSAAAQVCLRPPCRPVSRRQAAPRQLGVLCRHAHAAAAAATEQAAPDRPKGKAKGRAKDASASHTPRSCTRAPFRHLQTWCAALTSSRRATQTTRPTRTRSTCQRPASTCGPTRRSGSRSCKSSGRPTASTSSCWRPTRGCVSAFVFGTAAPRQGAILTTSVRQEPFTLHDGPPYANGCVCISRARACPLAAQSC